MNGHFTRLARYLCGSRVFFCVTTCVECCNVAAVTSTAYVSPSGMERSATSAAPTASTSAKTSGNVAQSIVANY